MCRFSLPDVQEAFQGPYMEKQDSDSEWKDYSGKIPDPRPGTVNTAALCLKHRRTNDSFTAHSARNAQWRADLKVR